MIPSSCAFCMTGLILPHLDCCFIRSRSISTVIHVEIFRRLCANCIMEIGSMWCGIWHAVNPGMLLAYVSLNFDFWVVLLRMCGFSPRRNHIKILATHLVPVTIRCWQFLCQSESIIPSTSPKILYGLEVPAAMWTAFPSTSLAPVTQPTITCLAMCLTWCCQRIEVTLHRLL